MGSVTALGIEPATGDGTDGGQRTIREGLGKGVTQRGPFRRRFLTIRMPSCIAAHRRAPTVPAFAVVRRRFAAS